MSRYQSLTKAVILISSLLLYLRLFISFSSLFWRAQKEVGSDSRNLAGCLIENGYVLEMVFSTMELGKQGFLLLSFNHLNFIKDSF